jgi:hypothetical protein
MSRDTQIAIKKYGRKYNVKENFYSKADDKIYLKNGIGAIVCIIERDGRGILSKLNDDPKLLAHLNRNIYNKVARGHLAQLKGNLYIDENGCIWKKSIEAVFHNPLFHNQNVKFTRWPKGDYETVISRNPDESNVLFTGKVDRDTYYQGTYNAGDSLIKHWNLDVKDHIIGYIKGYTHYANTKSPQYDEADYKDKIEILKIVFPEKYSKATSFKKEMDSDYYTALNKVFNRAKFFNSQEYKNQIKAINDKHSIKAKF